MSPKGLGFMFYGETKTVDDTSTTCGWRREFTGRKLAETSLSITWIRLLGGAGGQLPQRNNMRINDRGNCIYDDLEADDLIGAKRGEDRYHYDWGACSPKNGWLQWDVWQDASYFGMWINREKRATFCYAEGDRTYTTCRDEEHWQAEIVNLREWSGMPPPMSTSYDGKGGKEVYCDTTIPERWDWSTILQRRERDQAVIAS